MFSSRRSIALLAGAIFLLAASATILFISRSGDGGGSSSTSSKSAIWSVGDTWTVKVKQDSASISPDTKQSTALIPFRFEVMAAPKHAKGEWLVRVHQDGAAGPFRDGWRLAYTEKDSGKCAMELTHVGSGDQRMIEATVASIVLGSNFPYETCYSSAPKSSTVTGTELAKRAALPPLPANVDKTMIAPSGNTETGATPPKDAPVLKAGEVPPGAPPAAK
jgi:hypothetical protein